MIGKKIGRYEVKSELGRGGMATVYLAHDPLIGRDVAVKVLPREFLHDPSFRGRFEREARTVAMLEHPAIVPIYDFGEQDGQPYLVMRYMKGGTLGARIGKGPLSLDETISILKRLGAALDHAHKRGIIHRDLKPGNILFDEYARGYLSDFGIVKLAQATATFTGESIIGTPAYMSPEQVHGDKPVDPRSDIYTLGVILFEMLTGQMPYRADTPAKLMMAHVLNPVPRILEVRPDLPVACNDVISKALAKEPEERFSTASHLSVALQETLQSGTKAPAPPADEKQPPPPPLPPPSPPVSGTRRLSRKWLLPALGVIALLALCCAGFFLFSFLAGEDTIEPAATATTTVLVAAAGADAATAVTPDARATAAAAASATTQAETDSVATSAAATATARAAATATAQAQANAIGTRVVESTVTAQARAAATATAQAPTREVEVLLQAVFDAQSNEAVFGPADGSLVHIADGFIKADYADVEIADFLADAIFVNPYAAGSGDWDIGYMFRQTGNNSQYRLAVESGGSWSLTNWQNGTSGLIASGAYEGLDTGAGGSNRLTLLAQGGTGYFFINGNFVSELDLSARRAGGDIAVATSLFEGYEREGEETGYEAFTVWPLE